ncbi:MAG: CoA ester lyase [Actinobacteria bacterium]|nr:CoA ester lyase [Actinomycetota bacterium]
MQTRPYRSILFVPATRERWIAKAIESAADAIILDLEDAIADHEKAPARAAAAAAIERVAAAGKGAFVRVNAVSTPHWLKDLEAVVRPGLTAVALPKVDDPGQLLAADHVITALEPAVGLAPGSVDVQPLMETAAGLVDAARILAASPRVRSYFAGSAKDGDMNRELNQRWTREGRESLFVRSKLLLDGRAAGVPYPISGTWSDLGDLEGFRDFARESRDLGYVGIYVIHPSHLEIANQAFTPSASEVARCRAIVDAFAAAQRQGQGSARLEDVMIDKAMDERAKALLALAEAIGEGR